MAVLFIGSPFQGLAQETDTELATGVRQAQQGEFDAAVFTLDRVVQRLSSQPSRSRDLARAYVYLSVSYLGLNQEQSARERFTAALRADRDLRIDPREFPPRILRFFESVRPGITQPATTPSPSPRPAPSPRATPPATTAGAPSGTAAGSAPEKKGGSKTVPILIGVGAAAAVGIGVAASGGGGNATPTASPSPTPTPTPDPRTREVLTGTYLLIQRADGSSGNTGNFQNFTVSAAGHIDVTATITPTRGLTFLVSVFRLGPDQAGSAGADTAISMGPMISGTWNAPSAGSYRVFLDAKNDGSILSRGETIPVPYTYTVLHP